MVCEGCTSPARRRFLVTSAAALATLVPLRATVSEARYPIPGADGASIDSRNQVILVRDGAMIYAFALSCPHENTALRWRAKDKRFQCPRHESRYTPDGTFRSGRATRNMDRFPVSRAGEQIVVDLTRVFHSDADLPHWQAAVVTL